MEANQPEGHTREMDPDAADDRTAAESPDMLPADYWSVNKRSPSKKAPVKRNRQRWQSGGVAEPGGK